MGQANQASSTSSWPGSQTKDRRRSGSASTRLDPMAMKTLRTAFRKSWSSNSSIELLPVRSNDLGLLVARNRAGIGRFWTPACRVLSFAACCGSSGCDQTRMSSGISTRRFLWPRSWRWWRLPSGLPGGWSATAWCRTSRPEGHRSRLRTHLIRISTNTLMNSWPFLKPRNLT